MDLCFRWLRWIHGLWNHGNLKWIAKEAPFRKDAVLRVRALQINFLCAIKRALSGWGQLCQGRISFGFYLYVALASASAQLCGVHKSYNFPQWLLVNATDHKNTNRSEWGFTMLYMKHETAVTLKLKHE